VSDDLVGRLTRWGDLAQGVVSVLPDLGQAAPPERMDDVLIRKFDVVAHARRNRCTLRVTEISGVRGIRASSGFRRRVLLQPVEDRPHDLVRYTLGFARLVRAQVGRAVRIIR
jgi:hypothetical protein